MSLNPNRESTVNASHSVRDVLSSHYREGDVFERDQSYYDQLLQNPRRDRSQQKSPFVHTAAVQDSLRPEQSQVRQHVSVMQPSEQLARVRQENRLLREEVQKINGVDNQYGSSDEVVKKSHYTTSNSEAKGIMDQESDIINFQERIRKNNEKVETYRKAANELEIRMNNIQSIDQEIYKHLKNATLRDKELLQKASSALARGEPREEVARILSKVLDP